MKFFKTPRLFYWIFPRRTWGFSFSNNSVYLTFDDGPDPEITPFVLDFLKERNIKATFFCVGHNVVKYPELYQRILAEGHEVGNHTYDHLNYYKTDKERYLKSIDEAAEHISSTLFRPPYGRIDSHLSRTLSKRYHIVMWSWLSYDYDVQVPISLILKKAENIKAGDILVLHDNKKVKERVQVLLPELVEVLERKGFQFALIHNKSCSNF